MLDYEVTEDKLHQFYNIGTAHPASKHDLPNFGGNTFNIEVNNLTTTEQFETLDLLIKVDRGDVDLDMKADDEGIIQLLLSRGYDESSIASYLTTSKEFNPNLYLSTLFQDSSISELTQKLSILEKSIKLQQSDVQFSINLNFESYINCKESIDKALTKFKNQKPKNTETSIYMPKLNPRGLDKKNDSLYAELEDSVKNLNTALALMIRPIQENARKEVKLTKLIEFIKENDFLFNLSKNLVANIGQKNHDRVIEDYKRYIHEKNLIQTKVIPSLTEALNLTDDEKKIKEIKQERLLIITLTNKIFEKIDRIIVEHRERTYDHLQKLEHDVGLKGSKISSSESKAHSEFISIVDRIYQLDPDHLKNPISDFLANQITKLDEELNYQVKKFDDKFSSMQRKVSEHITSTVDSRTNGSHVRYIGEKFNQIEAQFKSSTNEISDLERENIVFNTFQSSDNLDASIISETWLVLANFINYIQENFCQNLLRFVKNYTHYGLEFEVDPEGNIRQKFDDLVNHVCALFVSLFEKEDDVKSSTHVDSVPSNFSQFLPFYTNSLSTIHYLTSINQKVNQLLNALGSAVGTLGNVSKSAETNKTIKSLRLCSVKINQLIIDAITCVWTNDCSQLYDLETWEISELETGENTNHSNGASYTKLINIIEYFNAFVLHSIKELLFLKDSPNTDIRIISTHPSKRTLVLIELQFIRCLDITLASIMKKYNADRKESLTRDVNVYKILTMNNFDGLSHSVYPALISKFDRLYSKDLTKQNLKIFSRIDQASHTIFEDIINKQKLKNNERILNFFESQSESTSLKVHGFIYDILMQFVKLIQVVKPITGNEIFVNLINELQQGVLKNLLDNIRSTSNLGSIDIINLKLDVNFFMEVFENSKALKINEASFRVIEIVLNTLEERLAEIGEADNTKAEFENILNENLSVSANQFDCF